MSAVIGYLRSIEWSMGNGQCPECYGIRPFFDGKWRRREPEGHRPACKLVAALVELGERPNMTTDPDPDPSRPQHPVIEKINADFERHFAKALRSEFLKLTGKPT